MTLLLLINFTISFRTCSTPKQSKNVTLSPFTCKAIKWAFIDFLRSVTYAPSYILGKIFLEKTPLNLGSFWWHFYISKLIKQWGGIKKSSPSIPHRPGILAFIFLPVSKCLIKLAPVSSGSYLIILVKHFLSISKRFWGT